uniref:Uncharacterized protein n=1 Tax=Daphnia galeata TaxID=27404 RepID=A0A8J2RZ38_9CRUS|nr:unnamed protein product [Daphnia galeata]
MAMKPLALGEVQLPPQYNHLLLNVIQETINSAFTNIPGIIENIFQRCERSTKEVHGRIDGVEVTRESLQKTEENLNKRFDTLEELSTQKQVHGRIDGVEENLKKTTPIKDLIL